MKLIINYDLFEEVLNARETLGPLKIIRNNKRQWAKFHLPILAITDFICYPFPLDIAALGIQFGIMTYLDLFVQHICKIDINKERAIDNLRDLSRKLKDLDVKTDYDLLLEAEQYKKEYKVKVNEKKLPYIAESKYIMVPTHDFNGNITDTSILQEHVVGSSEYVLSLGSPKKELKLNYARAY